MAEEKDQKKQNTENTEETEKAKETEKVFKEEAKEEKKKPEKKEKKKKEKKEKKEKEIVREPLPDFNVGDTLKVYTKIVEDEKTRVQPFQGFVMGFKGRGISRTFTVRRVTRDGIGVERIWPLACPSIVKIEVLKKGKVRRAKLYYMRKRKGKAAMKIKERRSKDQRAKSKD